MAEAPYWNLVSRTSTSVGRVACGAGRQGVESARPWFVGAGAEQDVQENVLPQSCIQKAYALEPQPRAVRRWDGQGAPERQTWGRRGLGARPVDLHAPARVWTEAGAEKSAVPKFASFRPKPPPQPLDHAAPPTAGSDSRPAKRRRSLSPADRKGSRYHRDLHSGGDRADERAKTRVARDRSHRPHDVRDRSGERRKSSGDHTRRLQHPSNLRIPAVAAVDHGDRFAADLTGDAQNLTYGRLHKYSIPSYRRSGYGRIIGLSKHSRIDAESSTEHTVSILDSPESKGPRERALLKGQRNRHLPELHVSASARDGINEDDSQDYILLRPGHGSNLSVHTSDHEGDEFRDYRDIRSTGPSHSRPTDPDLEYIHPDENQSPFDLADLQARQRNAELFRLTKQDPETLDVWLDLISHQEHLVNPGVKATDLSDVERRTLADMRISIYEKALKFIPATKGTVREHLLQGMLEEASIVWDARKYLQRSAEILRDHPTSFPLWTRYLDAAQTNPINFRFEDGKNFFLKCLHDIKSPASSARDDIDGVGQDVQLYILLRYTTFLREAGYEELSVATWQALIEFHIFKPNSEVEADAATALALFEQFWESEAPRFGEMHSRGWCHHKETDVIPPSDDPNSDSDELSVIHPFGSFAHREQAALERSPFPGRTMEETESDDPFHVIFYSDIKDVLETTGPRFSRRSLIQAFVIYLGLPAMQTDRASTGLGARASQWRSDVFLGNGLFGDSRPFMDHSTSESRRMWKCQITTDLLFSEVFPDLCHRNGHVETPLASFARRCLATLAQAFPSDDVLTEYHLAFEAQYFPATSSKVGKDILKKQPSSLRLYNACAIIEAKLDRNEKAEKIWAGALKMKDSFPAQSRADAVLLLRSWVWNELKLGHPGKALSLLLSYGIGDDSSDGEVSSAALLRATRTFKDDFEHALSQSQSQLISLNSECLALLAYHTQSNGLQAAVTVIHDHCAAVLKSAQTDTLALELLHQVKTGILTHHIHQKRSYKPAFIRSELEASIKAFPDNTMFLDLYRDVEKRFRIDDRVRSILKDEVIAKGQSPMVGWSFALDQEMSRFLGQASGSTAESVRATFTRALLSTGSAVRHSKTLWWRWFRFEALVLSRRSLESVSLGKHDSKQSSQKLKEVFLNGLHHLPWAKSWVLEGLRTFDSEDDHHWSMPELKSLFNVLIERELRVRVEGLEDLLDDLA
ncbi:hypothetical protein MBLNU459_g4568t1 [Dothideomycetes sp. NU459]